MLPDIDEMQYVADRTTVPELSLPIEDLRDLDEFAPQETRILLRYNLSGIFIHPLPANTKD